MTQIFVFPSISFRHICEANGRGIWTLRYHNNNEHDKRMLTKARKYANVNDYVLFYCSKEPTHGIVAIAKIKKLPTSDIYKGLLWEPGIDWWMVIELEFLNKLNEEKVITKKILQNLAGYTRSNAINYYLAPQAICQYAPLKHMSDKLFKNICNYFNIQINMGNKANGKE